MEFWAKFPYPNRTPGQGQMTAKTMPRMSEIGSRCLSTNFRSADPFTQYPTYGRAAPSGSIIASLD